MKISSKPWVAPVRLAVLSAVASSFAVPAQSQDLGKALAACATIAAQDARLTCFDALAVLVVGEHDDDQVVATAVVAAATDPVPLTDAVGKERVAPKKADEREKYSSRVVACQESAQSGQYYFTLDNGQVWKQSNYRRLGFRDCAFDIELSKGSLGYQMYIPSKDRSVRVARVK